MYTRLAVGFVCAAMIVFGQQQAWDILNASCVPCHNAKVASGKLRMDSLAELKKSGVSGVTMMARITSEDRAVRMPLGLTPLPAEKIAVLRKWIDSGAAGLRKSSAPHWAYTKPAPPASSSGNAIDRFLLARLERQGLKFSPEASKETLIRRVSLDLIGLPPSLKEVDEFLADTSPEAYQRLVDRLLASKHYGERWARPWLDLARYADTNGYEKDRRRTMWKYRDWVIDALNRNLPFDQFTMEQIAGDMLPNATTDQKIATGFHRNTMFNEEGGVDKEEAHFEVLVDRVATTATVWLGSSLGCAQCHNHKYDPFTQKDFYSLMAFFSPTRKEVQEYGDTSTKFREAQLDLATPEQEKARQSLNTKIQELDKRLKTSTPELQAAQKAWEAQIASAFGDWRTMTPSSVKALHGATLGAGEGGTILASGDNPRRETYIVQADVPTERLTGLRIETLPHQGLPRGGPGRDIYGNFLISSINVELLRGEKSEPLAFKRVLIDDGRSGDSKKGQLWSVDASRDDTRLPRQLVLVFASPVNLDTKASLRVTIEQNSDFTGQAMGQFRLSSTGAADPSLVVKVRAKLRPVLMASTRSGKDERDLAEFYRSIAPSLDGARKELRQLRNELDRLGVMSALVMSEGNSFERPFDFIRTRGGFAAKAEKVFANVPAALNPLPENAMPNRLGLARWLVSKENPLTARVAMNRIWEQYFGRGIVETSEDFGTQGERPVNPELLDWLATEFMARNWDMKAMHRLIVTSAAYRQTSRVTPELLQADPNNRLVSRGPRFRMEAEMIRDASLAASGLLSRKIGGPSVFPPQPPGVWDIPYNDDQWMESTGEDKYRRGIYTFVRRSALYPSMVNFDATSRESCTVKRIRTNTPLQALNTLNDAAFFETARALAKRILTEGGVTERQRMETGFRLTTSRRPAPAELDGMLTWLRKEQAYFTSRTSEAERIGGSPEQASWVMLANVLLNLDEALTKE
ncbi:MAG: PSD1 domain-containing protein [Candidatus Solibacter usitatus]|nr:PSD1 domain-containing protein [Candidatus Solibacter usitatus]